MGLLSKRRFWAWPRELRRRGIPGINARSGHYISRLNPRALYPRVDVVPDAEIGPVVLDANAPPARPAQAARKGQDAA